MTLSLWWLLCDQLPFGANCKPHIHNSRCKPTASDICTTTSQSSTYNRAKKLHSHYPIR